MTTFSASAQRGFDRWVPLSRSSYNFRDIGAYDAGTTQVVATGRLFRSASLEDLTTTDAGTILWFGVRTIIDLRPEPRTTDSVYLNSFTKHVYIPVGFSGATGQEIYRNLILAQGKQWQLVFKVLADRRNYPLDFHCQAGKDRAGVLTALILTLLGVKRETVIQDYLLSNIAYRSTVVDQTWIEAALDAVETSGGIQLYLDAIGTTESVRRAVRANLLIPRPTRARPSWHSYQ